MGVVARSNMNTRTSIVVIGLLVLLLLAKFNTASVLDSQSTGHPSEEKEQSIEETIEALSLEEKVGQMLLLGIPSSGGVEELRTLVAQGKIGSVILMGPNIGTTTESVRATVESLQGAVQHDVPLFVSVDQEGGIVSRLKGDQYETTGQPDVETTGHAEVIARTRAEDLRSLGINVNFAPVLEYITNEESFLFDRVFRGDQERVGDFGTTMIREYQKNGVIATAKHFPGHANDSLDSHTGLPSVDMSKVELPEHIAIFERVIDESNPGMVMMAHVLFPEVDSKYPSSISRYFVTDLLRRDLGFEGVIITDDMNMGAITRTYGQIDAALQAVRAGNDILLYVGNVADIDAVHEAIMNKIASGVISEARINESVRRILTLKEKFAE